MICLYQLITLEQEKPLQCYETAPAHAKKPSKKVVVHSTDSCWKSFFYKEMNWSIISSISLFENFLNINLVMK